MRLALVLIAALLLCGCASQECFTVSQLEYAIAEAYAIGVAAGYDACPDCASQECYTTADIDAAYTWGYQVGRASLLKCPDCPPCPDTHSEIDEHHVPPGYRAAAMDAARRTNEQLADEIAELQAEIRRADDPVPIGRAMGTED